MSKHLQNAEQAYKISFKEMKQLPLPGTRVICLVERFLIYFSLLPNALCLTPNLLTLNCLTPNALCLVPLT